MKKIIYSLIVCLLSTASINAQNVGIGTTTPNSSALLEVKATNKGVLIPQVALQSLTDVTTVPAPATSLLVYNTNATLGAGYYYNAGTSTAPNWAKLVTTATPISGWSTTGNAGTTAANFIGTTDGQPLLFKINKVQSGIIDSVNHNTSIGYKTLYANTSGFDNTAGGYATLASNSTGTDNTANGFATLFLNTTGSNNTASGTEALYNNYTGSYNTATGALSLLSNTTGKNNVANGAQALFHNTTGYSNVGIGIGALYNNTTVSNLVAVGDSALYNQAVNQFSIYGNTAIGSKALFSNSTGFFNTALGSGALYYNTTGSGNTVSGNGALYYNTTGNGNIANGEQTLYSNTTGSNNAANGSNALLNNTTGNNNVANGAGALYYNLSGYSNVAIGVAALHNNTDGYNMVAVGDSALYNQQGASVTSYPNANTAIGSKALFSNTTGFANAANGYYTLYANTTGDGNTANGAYSLSHNNTGYDNTALGSGAGQFSTGNYNIFIGNSADYNVSSTADNQLNIGNWIFGDNGKIGIGSGSNAKDPTRAQLVIDGSAAYTLGTYGFLNNTNPTGTLSGGTVNASIWASNRVVAQEFDATSDARIKRDIEPLPDNSLTLLKKINVVSYNKLNKGGYTSEIGILGQELEKILPTAVKQSEGDVYNDSTHQWEVVKDFRTVNYQSLNLLTTKAVQELNEKVEAQQKEIDELKALVKELMGRK